MRLVLSGYIHRLLRLRTSYLLPIEAAIPHSFFANWDL